jgi:hypothetical protein
MVGNEGRFVLLDDVDDQSRHDPEEDGQDVYDDGKRPLVSVRSLKGARHRAGKIEEGRVAHG